MAGVIIMVGLLVAVMLVILYRSATKPKNSSAEPVKAMSKEDQLTIENFARGDNTLKRQAIAAYRRTPKLEHGDEGIAHYLFMREVDTVAPDYGWLRIQRDRLLEDLNE